MIVEGTAMFKELQEINSRPAPFQFYTAEDLWTDDHTSLRMLEFHLDGTVDVSSRNSDFIAESVAWIADRFEVSDQTRIADFGCGPGLYTLPLAERGAVVTGIDFSKRSIDYARRAAAEKNIGVDYVRTNYLDFETSDRFDLILMIMCDYCALSPAQRRHMLHKFHSLLKQSGAILLDVYSLKSFDKKTESASYERNQLDGFWSPDDYYAFVNTFKYETEKVILDKFTIVEAERTRVVYNWLQHFSRDALVREFEASGYRIEGLYSDVAGRAYSDESPEMAIAAGMPEK